MRIHRLEIEGFGPFRDRQTVDFDAFAQDGIFLIGGKTGAGKSSILDAVCFALYGGVPRYEDGEKRLRSDHSSLDEPTRVRLEFSSGDRRWRIERVPTYERRKRNGHGTTQSPAEARLEEWVDGGWVGRAARPVDVGNELGPILGLNQQQFLQVILLAQGRFARFLLAKNDERQALLRTLFDSHRFEGYEGALERRRRETAERLTLENRVLLMQLESAEALAAPDDDPEARLELLAASLDERLERVAQARLRAAHARELSSAREQTAKEAHDAADAAHAAAVAQSADQQRRDRARAALALLESRADGGRRRSRRAFARAGRRERCAARSTPRAGRAPRSRRGRRAASGPATPWIADGHEDADCRPTSTDSPIDLAGDVGAWKVALAAEQGLDALCATSARRPIDAARVGATPNSPSSTSRRAELPALAARLGAAIAEAAVRAAARPEAATRVAEARDRLAAAREADVPRVAVARRPRRSVAAAGGRSRVRPPNSTGCASGGSAITPANSPSC